MRSTALDGASLLCILGLLAGAPGCGGDDGSDADPLEIAGRYNDGFSDHEISDTTWTMKASGMADSVFHIASYTNGDDFLVAENDASNEWNAGKWSRFDWAYSGSDLYMCQVAFGADSQADAVAATGANRSDLVGSGCGGFPWSKLTPKG